MPPMGRKSSGVARRTTVRRELAAARQLLARPSAASSPEAVQQAIIVTTTHPARLEELDRQLAHAEQEHAAVQQRVEQCLDEKRALEAFLRGRTPEVQGRTMTMEAAWARYTQLTGLTELPKEKPHRTAPLNYLTPQEICYQRFLAVNGWT